MAKCWRGGAHTAVGGGWRHFLDREKSGETGWAMGMEFSNGPLNVSGDAGWWDPQ